MTQEQFNVLDPKVASHREELLRTQQGDFNAVLMYDGYVITDQKTTNSENTIIMLLCSCRKTGIIGRFQLFFSSNSPKYQTIAM